MENLTNLEKFEKEKKELEKEMYDFLFLIYQKNKNQNFDWENYENTWAIQNGYS